jgi:hypothetical protein
MGEDAQEYILGSMESRSPLHRIGPASLAGEERHVDLMARAIVAGPGGEYRRIKNKDIRGWGGEVKRLAKIPLLLLRRGFLRMPTC